MQMIFFLLLKQTVPNSDMRYFRASVIYIYTNPMEMYELMRIRHMYIMNSYLIDVHSSKYRVAVFDMHDFLAILPVDSINI